MTDKELFERAMAARCTAYAPYSGFAVGAALLCADGRVFTGCNIENAAYPAALCAERAAVAAAISAGARDWTAMAVAGGRDDTQAAGVACTPCGICRQVLSELGGADLRVITADGVHTLGELLPLSFALEVAP